MLSVAVHNVEMGDETRIDSHEEEDDERLFMSVERMFVG